MSTTSSYSDAASYGVQQVVSKDWPMPSQSGGKRKHSAYGICPMCGKRHSSHTACHNGGRRRRTSGTCHKCGRRHQKGCSSSRRNKKGGFVQQAMVPFGLFALQKRTQGRHGRGNKSSRKSRSSRRSRKNRGSRRR